MLICDWLIIESKVLSSSVFNFDVTPGIKCTSSADYTILHAQTSLDYSSVGALVLTEVTKRLINYSGL